MRTKDEREQERTRERETREDIGECIAVAMLTTADLQIFD